MPAYYVSVAGEVLGFEIHSPNTLKLSNGSVIDDPPLSGHLFASKSSADKFAELLRETGDLLITQTEFDKWLRDKLDRT